MAVAEFLKVIADRQLAGAPQAEVNEMWSDLEHALLEHDRQHDDSLLGVS